MSHWQRFLIIDVNRPARDNRSVQSCARERVVSDRGVGDARGRGTDGAARTARPNGGASRAARRGGRRGRGVHRMFIEPLVRLALAGRDPSARSGRRVLVAVGCRLSSAVAGRAGPGWYCFVP
jgi:hypothetical protein